MPSMQDFCSKEVEAFGKDADHLQITALCAALKVSLDVVYLSGSPTSMSGDANGASAITACDIVHFDSDAGEALAIGSLLYRPGHFDLLAAQPDAASH